MQSLLQTPEWAEFKMRQGWQSFWLENISLLSRPLPGGKSFLYIPEVSISKDQIKDLLEKAKPIAKGQKAAFLRLEIFAEENQEYDEQLTYLGFKKSFEEVQPEDRQWLPISRPKEEILAQMKSKGRYNIRIAERHKVEIKSFQKANLFQGLDDFYHLYQQTFARQRFSGRSRQYFRDLLDVLGKKDYLRIYTAFYQNQPLASVIITFYQELASYLYGASSNEHREVMAPYLAHWQAILEAKEKGCQLYDLLAIAPAEILDHKYASLSRFKQQFGGRSVKMVGSWDYIFQPTWYWAFRVAEKMRRGIK